MPFIKVSEKLFEIYVPMDQGYWQAQIGHIVDINEFRFSFVAKRSINYIHGFDIVISELSSGCEFRRIPFDGIELKRTDTKEKAVNLFSNIALIVAEDIEKLGREDFIEITKRGKTTAFEICGPMPEIKEVG